MLSNLHLRHENILVKLLAAPITTSTHIYASGNSDFFVVDLAYSTQTHKLHQMTDDEGIVNEDEKNTKKNL